MGKKLETKWKCHECDEIHNDECSAYECCRPEVTEGYECPVCLYWHSTEAMALDCCGYDEDAPPRPPTAAELEEIGQLRLIE